MKRLAISLLLAGCSSGSFHFENDLLAGWLTHNNDRYYTQGTQFTYAKVTENQKETYSLGQTIYTPSNKHADASSDLLKADRPYAGWLYLEYRNTKQTNESTQDTYGVQLGCLGACSYAKEVQQNFHKAIHQGIPAWLKSDELKSEPGFILEAERKKVLYESDYFDFAISGMGRGGNIIDAIGASASGRIGFGLDTFASTPIVFKIDKNGRTFPDDFKKKQRWHFYTFAKAEERLVGYNHLLDGSLFQSESHTVTHEPFVHEFDAGVTLGYKKFKITYTYTYFSSEWKEKRQPFAFAGLSFDW